MKNLNKALGKRFKGKVKVVEEDKIRYVYGSLSSWDDIVEACYMCVSKDKDVHVVNNIKLDNVNIPKTKMPSFFDESLEGSTFDVLIIGGGISGCSIARELMKWKVSCLLVDKEYDLAYHSSSRNDGEVHPGIDLKKGTLKHKYLIESKKIYEKVCRELGVDYERCGQYVAFRHSYMKPIMKYYIRKKARDCQITDSVFLSKEELEREETNMGKDFAFGIKSTSAGRVCPYNLTIAYGENAVENGCKVSLNTGVISMEVEDGNIVSVLTNRGRIYPKFVVNAAGTFADEVAEMAGDRFYSIHPRRGTNMILDRKSSRLVKSIVSWKDGLKKEHTKGGGIIHTVDDNLLVGPDAVETYYRENYETKKESIENVFNKHKITVPNLKKEDIITYFTGIRAATFEEDYIIERGRKTSNLFHVAGIQSPGLTTAPAVALDVAKKIIEILEEKGEKIEENTSFDPVRKVQPVLRKLSLEERNRLIKENADYGVILCRCEEISKGEIIDALKRPIAVSTIDGIKRRLRAGMGRCQGGFCMPLISKVISETLNIPVSEVLKGREGSVISFGKTKGEKHD